MSDLRDPEPPHRIIDATDRTYGSAKFEVDIDVWPYSSLRNEKVFSRKVTFLFWSERMKHAALLAEIFAETIKSAHDVWEVRITRVEVVR